MPMAESLPYKSVRKDATLRLYSNGKLPESLLKNIHTGRQGFSATLYGPAAWWFNVMWSAAEDDGIILKSVSRGYRSYQAQETMFLERYSSKPTLRKPVVTRKWQGKTWFLKRGKSPSATPGFSNHGLGLAQDVDVSDPRVFKWLCANGPKYGFFLAGPRTLPNGKTNPEFEAWHWQFCNL
jgi:LAS superfamily LD-carboxypeptidase LdcB